MERLTRAQRFFTPFDLAHLLEGVYDRPHNTPKGLGPKARAATASETAAVKRYDLLRMARMMQRLS